METSLERSKEIISRTDVPKEKGGLQDKAA